MKVAIVHPSLALKGGAENVVVWLATGLRSRGHAVTLFTAEFDGRLWPAEHLRGLDIAVLKTKTRFMNSTLLTFVRLGRMLRKALAGFDIVNCHNWPSNLWVARARRWSRAFPRVVWYCEEPNRKIHWERTNRHLAHYVAHANDARYNAHLRHDVERERRTASRSRSRRRKRARDIRWDVASAAMMDKVLVNSRFSQESVEKVYGITPSVCYLGIPLAGKEPVAAKGDYFCVVSPLTRKKNVHNVIEAMNILVNQRKLDGVRLKIVGDGPERAAIEGLAAQYGLGDRVAFLGFVSDAQVVRTYQAARLTVYVPIDEPFGLVPLESMACGTPVVASDHGGPLDSVVANETGLHVNPFDPEAIADAIQALFCDEARLRAMGASGARWVRERFTLEGFLDRFEQMALRS